MRANVRLARSPSWDRAVPCPFAANAIHYRTYFHARGTLLHLCVLNGKYTGTAVAQPPRRHRVSGGKPPSTTHAAHTAERQIPSPSRLSLPSQPQRGGRRVLNPWPRSEVRPRRPRTSTYRERERFFPIGRGRMIMQRCMI